MTAYVYRVCRYYEHFETHTTRKLERCRWVSMPNGHDGLGVQRVLHDPKGLAIFGAWCLIVQTLSRQARPRNGWLTVDGLPPGPDGTGTPWTNDDLSFRWRCRPEDIQEALDLLSSPQVGWIERIPIDEIPAYLDSDRSADGPESRQESADSGHESADSMDESADYVSESAETDTENGKERRISGSKRSSFAVLPSKSAPVVRARESSPVQSSPVQEGRGARARADGSAAAPPPPPDWHRGGWDRTRAILNEHGAEFLDQDRERWERIVDDHPGDVLPAIDDAKAAGRKRTARAIGKLLDDQAEERHEARRAENEARVVEERRQRMAADQAKADRHREDLELARAQGPTVLAQVDRLIGSGCEPPGGGATSVARWIERCRAGEFSPIAIRRIQDWINTGPQPAARPAEPAEVEAPRRVDHQDPPPATNAHQDPPADYLPSDVAEVVHPAEDLWP